jgi:hypothetical protein
MWVEALAPQYEEAYEAFVVNHPAGLLYESLRFRELLTSLLPSCRDLYLLALDGGDIRGVLPVLATDGPDGRVVNSLPYYGSHGGPLGDVEACTVLLDAWDELATADGTAAATLIQNPFATELPREPSHNLVDQRLNQTTDLRGRDASPSAVLELIDGSARRNVRKASRAGVIVETAPGELPAVAEIHRENMTSIGVRPKDKAFFEAVHRIFRAGDDFDVFVAQLDGEVVAGLLVFYFGRTAEYYTPVVRHDHRASQPLAAVLLHALVHARGRGIERWNWGGTGIDNEGVFRFKRKWGAETRRYSYFTRLGSDDLRSRGRDAILEAYGHFYVLPFSALQPREESSSPARL